MPTCRRCGNTSHFNVWCSIQKVLEVELEESGELMEIVGEPEDETLQNMEEIELMEDDLAFAMVSCAWCGSKDVAINGREEALCLSVHH